MLTYGASPTLVPRPCNIVHKFVSDISHFMSIIHVLLQWHDHVIIVEVPCCIVPQKKDKLYIDKVSCCIICKVEDICQVL